MCQLEALFLLLHPGNGDQFHGLLRDVLGADFELLNQFPRRAGIAEAVLYADGARNDRRSQKLGTFRDYATHAPRQGANLVLLGGDHNARLLGRPHDSCFINRLHGVHVDHASLVAKFLLQYPRRAHRLGHHRPTGDDAEIFVLVFVIGGKHSLERINHFRRFAAETAHVRDSKHKWRVLASDNRRGFARETDVLGPDVLEQQIVGRLARLDGVAGHHDRHVRQSAHGEQIFQRLVRGAIGSNRNSAVSAGDQYIEISVADGNPDLVQIAGRGKGPVGAEDRQLPFPRQSRGGSGRRLFRNAHADPAIFAFRFARIEIADSDRAGNVEAEADHSLIIAIVLQRFSKALAGGLHLHFHLAGAVPPVFVRETRSLGSQCGLHFLLILIRLLQQCIVGDGLFQSEFFQGLHQFVIAGSLAVPSGNVLHEADALALHGIGNNHSGLAGDRIVLRLLQSVQDLGEVVAVNFDHFPAKATIALVQRLDVHHVLDPAVNLQTVAVNDGHQIVEFEVRCLHDRFPDIAFLLLAVAHDAEHRMLAAVEFASQSHADRNAETLSQRSAGDFDARQLQAVRMSLEWRIKLAQSNNVFDGKVSGEGEAKIQSGGFMPGRPDDAIAFVPIRIVGIVVGDLQVQGRNDVHDGERASGMAGAGGAKRNQVIAAHQAGGLLKFFQAELANYGFRERVDDRHDESFVPVKARLNVRTRDIWTPISKARLEKTLGL